MIRSTRLGEAPPRRAAADTVLVMLPTAATWSDVFNDEAVTWALGYKGDFSEFDEFVHRVAGNLEEGDYALHGGSAAAAGCDGGVYVSYGDAGEHQAVVAAHRDFIRAQIARRELQVEASGTTNWTKKNVRRALEDGEGVEHAVQHILDRPHVCAIIAKEAIMRAPGGGDGGDAAAPDGGAGGSPVGGSPSWSLCPYLIKAVADVQSSGFGDDPPLDDRVASALRDAIWAAVDDAIEDADGGNTDGLQLAMDLLVLKARFERSPQYLTSLSKQDVCLVRELEEAGHVDSDERLAEWTSELLSASDSVLISGGLHKDDAARSAPVNLSAKWSACRETLVQVWPEGDELLPAAEANVPVWAKAGSITLRIETLSHEASAALSTVLSQDSSVGVALLKRVSGLMTEADPEEGQCEPVTVAVSLSRAVPPGLAMLSGRAPPSHGRHKLVLGAFAVPNLNAGQPKRYKRDVATVHSAIRTRLLFTLAGGEPRSMPCLWLWFVRGGVQLDCGGVLGSTSAAEEFVKACTSLSSDVLHCEGTKIGAAERSDVSLLLVCSSEQAYRAAGLHMRRLFESFGYTCERRLALRTQELSTGAFVAAALSYVGDNELEA